MPQEEAVATQPKPAKSAPNPSRDPVGYLEAKGWLCFGDTEDKDVPCWFDPTKPRREKYRKVPVIGVTQSGEKHPVTVKDLRTGREIPAMQTEYTPPAVPLTRTQALMEQRTRDADYTLAQQEAEERKRADLEAMRNQPARVSA